MSHLLKKYHVPKICTVGFNVVIIYCFKILFKKILNYFQTKDDYPVRTQNLLNKIIFTPAIIVTN